MTRLATLLLIVGGAVHALPQLNAYLITLTGGTPIIQIVVGVLSVLIGITALRDAEPAISI